MVKVLAEKGKAEERWKRGGSWKLRRQCVTGPSPPLETLRGIGPGLVVSLSMSSPELLL